MANLVLRWQLIHGRPLCTVPLWAHWAVQFYFLCRSCLGVVLVTFSQKRNNPENESIPPHFAFQWMISSDMWTEFNGSESYSAFQFGFGSANRELELRALQFIVSQQSEEVYLYRWCGISIINMNILELISTRIMTFIHFIIVSIKFVVSLSLALTQSAS